ncbi:type III secretion system stator protein SctL [Pleionea sediminis]|uniref:type III secretion system stator protein SctL n=1 Tax=Pleionea sediminis TaxID=2569479 RepID=UPI001186FFED|nr:type III secretion system stator protein SctL [Pleionea sediminis]
MLIPKTIQIKDSVNLKTQNIIKHSELQSLLQAEELLKEAKSEAEKIRQSAFEDREKSIALGYQEGLKNGHEDAIQLLLKTQKDCINFIQGQERLLVEIINDALEHILNKMDRASLVGNTVRHLINQKQSNELCSLMVHSQDLDAVSTQMDSEPPLFDLVDVIKDDTLSPGQCMLKTPVGTLESSIDTQLNSLRKMLEQETVNTK